ncbi:microbial collagenase [Streptomyces sp. SLBN-118]|uniref:collagenase n=1 Tax=Streptomyces sp. SLBN-118 TaxID=2768454 RepID=UPI001150B20B|nr:collagenase [Streptomyces sp. SLBN-118]TQK42727.1 microbial collagenase [Streptomyces sp. SLBN-118]
MSQLRSVRKPLLAGAISVALLAPFGQTAQAVDRESAALKAPATFAARPGPAAKPASAPGGNPFDEVEHLAKAPKPAAEPASAPGGLAQGGRTPGRQGPGKSRASSIARVSAAGVPCTLDGITRLTPEQFADFLADPAVTADGCLRGLIWTWDARLVPVMSDAHVQAVGRRISSLAAAHNGRNGTHLLEMFTYLHAVVYHDFSRPEIDITDAPTTEILRRAIYDFGTAARTFQVTQTNAETLREALYTGSAPGLRHSQLGLIRKVLATMDRFHKGQYDNASWGGAALAALSVNYLGIYPGNRDSAFHNVVTQNASYRASFRAFADYTHLKGTVNEWVVRDALGEYGRFGQVDALKARIVPDLGALLPVARANFGDGSRPWASLVSWLNFYEACKPYAVCKEDIERKIFPYTYTYDNGAIKVRTGLDRATVDQLYYASKQVRAHFHRVLGTEQPLVGDTNTSLTIVLYGSRADYEVYHPILTGMGTQNGGIYIERGATFYTYQRRVPQDSSLTLEELFRHEYVHYLNGRWAVPGYFGEGPWYSGDRTTAMDEGTAEFFDGATRDDGIRVRKSLVRGIINDTAGGGPRMTVNQLLHATYDGDGFRFYNYAGTFFEYLWTERPALLREMYGYLRADDPAGFDAWRTRLGGDAALQRSYDSFLDAQIAKLDDLFVPQTSFTPNDQLRDATSEAVRQAFATATYADPVCSEGGEPGKRRFTCTGRITANLSDASSADSVFKDMSETVDYFILDRARPASNNLADMNCSFGPVEIWSNRTAGSATYSCEGPLRS